MKKILLILVIPLLMGVSCTVTPEASSENKVLIVPEWQKPALWRKCLKNCTKDCQTIGVKTVCQQDLSACETDCENQYGD